MWYTNIPNIQQPNLVNTYSKHDTVKYHNTPLAILVNVEVV